MRDIWKSDFNRLQKIIHGIVLGTAILSVWAVFGLNGAHAATISRPMQNLGLVGYWSFDVGKGGAKAVDMSGRGNNGTLTPALPR